MGLAITYGRLFGKTPGGIYRFAGRGSGDFFPGLITVYLMVYTGARRE